MGPITIVLADDHQIVREGFKALLENQPGFSVVAEASDGLAAVQIVTKLKPRVLTVDIMMPGLNGLEVTRQVRKLSPNTKVIILSMHMNEPYVIEALQNGAHAYVLKESSVADLIKAIHEVIGGRHYLSPPYLNGQWRPTWKRQRGRPSICIIHSRRASGKSFNLSCRAEAMLRSPPSFT